MNRLIVTTALLASTMFVARADGQFLVVQPDGTVGLQRSDGSYRFYHPSAFSPGRNSIMPGTQPIVTQNGVMWIGQDGRPHGEVVDPSTGNHHTYARFPTAGLQNMPRSTGSFSSGSTSTFRSRTSSTRSLSPTIGGSTSIFGGSRSTFRSRSSLARPSSVFSGEVNSGAQGLLQRLRSR